MNIKKRIMNVILVAILSITIWGCNDKKNTLSNNEKNNELKSVKEEKKDKLLGKEDDLYNNNALDDMEEEYDCKKCIRKVKDYDAYDTVLGSTSDGFKLAPNSYDGDVAWYKDYIEEVKCAKDALYFDMNITNIHNIDKGERIHKCTFKEVSKEEVEESIKDASAGALIWFNDKKEIEKMVIYGEITIQE